MTIRDLTGYSMWVTFTGFEVENMNFGLELKAKQEAIFSRGIESSAPGFWRVVKADGDKEQFEVTHPVLPEYMFFFDLWEKTLLWRGRLDMTNGRIVNGEVIANKKRFGIIPYTETLATFEADLLPPGQKLPDVQLPNFSELNFLPPEDFETPFDMKNYPQYFSKEFVDYFFATEEALANGQEPPKRPKAFFVPDPNVNMLEDGGDADENAAEANDLKKERSGAKGKTSQSGKAFGKK